MATSKTGTYSSYPVTSKSRQSTALADAMAEYTQKYDEAKTANLKRYDEGMSIYDEIINRYRPGGTFGQAALQQLESQKQQYIGKGTQNLVSSGLFGSTVRSSLPGVFEKEIGAPYRLKLEDLMMERLSQAQLGKSQFMERREDTYPDLNQMAELTSRAAQSKGTQTTIIGSRDTGSGVSYSPGTPSAGFLTGGGGTPREGFSYGSKQNIADYSSVYAEQLANAQKPQTTYDPASFNATDKAQETAQYQPTASTATTSTSGGAPEEGMVKGAYGTWTWGPTVAKESIAYSKWKKSNPGGTMKDWRLQY